VVHLMHASSIHPAAARHLHPTVSEKILYDKLLKNTMGGYPSTKVGISIGQAIYSVYCRRKSLRFPMLTLTPRPRHSARAFGNSKTLPYARLAVTASDGMTDFTTQDPVCASKLYIAYTQSIGTIWLVNAPLVGAGLLMGTSPFVL